MGNKKHKPVEVTQMCFEDSGYVDRSDDYWKATTLYDAAKSQKCKIYNLPIEHIDLTPMPFSITNLYGFAYHVKRMMDTNLKYPVLVGPLGGIMDGWHRIAKALMKKKTFVKAIKLNSLPEPDEKGRK